MHLLDTTLATEAMLPAWGVTAASSGSPGPSLPTRGLWPGVDGSGRALVLGGFWTPGILGKGGLMCLSCLDGCPGLRSVV